MSGRWKAFSLAIMLGAMAMMTGCQGKSDAAIDNDVLTISQYNGVEVERADKQEVTDETVESEIQNILNNSAEEVEVTGRPSENGDIVDIDYEGKLDGVPFDGGSAEHYSLTLGSGAFIPGFEDAVVGHEIGETFDIDVTFPEQYQAAELAGKATVFTITLHGIKTREVPELTDEFVAEVSETSKTVDEYREEVKAELEEVAETNYVEGFRSAVWAKVCENVTIKEYPADRLEEVKNNMLNQYETMAGYYGTDLSGLIQSMGYESEDEFMEKLEETAKQSLLQMLTMEAIAEKENLSVNESDADYSENLEALAKKYNYESGEQLISEAGAENVHDSLLLDKVLDLITSNCNVATK